MTAKQRELLYGMFGCRCAYCGCELPLKGWHADHVEPVQRKTSFVRGEDGRLIVTNGRVKMKQEGFWSPENHRSDNYYPACAPCNIDKSCMPLELWRKSLQDKINVALRSSNPLRHAKRFGMVAISEAPIVFWFEKYTPVPKDGQ